jgi:uncharacterized protein (UPF0332 family)
VSPESQEHIDKAREYIVKARTFLEVNNYPDEAGRAAYLAAFHAAQALISERTGRVAKTHTGVRSQFSLLTKADVPIDLELRRFLSDGFNLKSVADYETGPDAHVPPDQASLAITAATRFVDVIAKILA